MVTKHELHIPAVTFIKIFVALIVAAVIVKLFPLLLIVLLSAFLATALDPVVSWLCRKGLSRGLAYTATVVALVAVVAFFFIGLIPQLFSQISTLGEKIGPLQSEILQHVPGGHMRSLVERSMADPSALFGRLPDFLATIGTVAFSGIYAVGLFLIVSIYLLIDGGRAYRWISGFFQPKTQAKLDETAVEMKSLIFAYVGGQFLTSAIVAVYVFTLHSILGVPGALLLATLAALLDVLPIIGFMISTFFAVLMALTVSPGTALIVVAAYLFYQALENYLIVPRIYGSRMKLSTLVVLLSFLFAGTLAGVMGALLVLPIVASYPIIEKIWLRRYLGSHVVESHQTQLEEGEEPSARKDGSLVENPV